MASDLIWGGVYFSSIPCTPIVGPGIRRFGPKLPKWLKKGVHPVLTSFSVRSLAARPCCHRFSKKSGICPRWTIRRGGGPHFFPKFGERVVWVPGIFPVSCFYPHSTSPEIALFSSHPDPNPGPTPPPSGQLVRSGSGQGLATVLSGPDQGLVMVLSG